MRLRRLHLQAFGPFTDRWIDFGPGLTLLAGPNEAGKSSMLRALTALRFGIEHRSTDNFVHEHARMALGAVVLDREGRELQLLRRKGREPTLSVVAPDGGSLPASADLELQLTGGLKRADHDLMFALDHQRLRAGGEQLLAGQGEIGAALFEASAGVHSLRTVLDRLDQQARSRLVPRGSTGSVNIALRRHREQHEALRAAQLRPAEWAALRQRADETQAALERARENRAAADLALRDLRERIAVAPLLRTLDDTRAELAALSLLPPPDEDLPRQRIALQTREHELQTARAAQQALRARLDEQLQALPAGTPRWLEQAAGIDRLVAAADGLEAARLQCRELEQQGQALDRQLEAAAQALEPGAGVQALLARRPDAAWQARMEAATAQLQEQARALAQHLDDLAAERGAETSPSDLTEPPAALATQVQALQQRCDRLAPEVALLAGREALERQRAERHEMLQRTALQLGGAAMASRALTACPRLEADIDQALREREAAATRLAALAQRIDQIDEARRGRAAERAQLLAAGAVPTDDDIAEARRVRDALWRRLADGPAAPSTEDRALFAQLLDHADRLADGRSRDGERAARLQALQRSLAELDEDRAVLDMQRQALQRDLEHQGRIWDEALAEAGLPRLAPQALREWQQHQARHLEAAQALQSVDEALQALDRRVQAAVAELHEALGPMPAGVVPDDAAALLGRARARLQALRERQTALEAQRSAHQAAQQRLERLARQTAQRRAAERQAHAALQALLDEDGRGVVLPEDALQALALANARRQAGERLRTLAEQRELQTSAWRRRGWSRPICRSAPPCWLRRWPSRRRPARRCAAGSTGSRPGWARRVRSRASAPGCSSSASRPTSAWRPTARRWLRCRRSWGGCASAPVWPRPSCCRSARPSGSSSARPRCAWRAPARCWPRPRATTRPACAPVWPAPRRRTRPVPGAGPTILPRRCSGSSAGWPRPTRRSSRRVRPTSWRGARSTRSTATTARCRRAKGWSRPPPRCAPSCRTGCARGWRMRCWRSRCSAFASAARGRCSVPPPRCSRR